MPLGLPNYQRFVNGVPVPMVARRSLRSKEKYLIILVFLTFTCVCFGAFFFLPDKGTTAGTVKQVYSVYQHIQQAGPEFLLPIPPHGELDAASVASAGANRKHNHGVAFERDPHLLEDRAKLEAKIKLDTELQTMQQKVLDRPVLAPRSSSASPVAALAATIEKRAVPVSSSAKTVGIVPPDPKDGPLPRVRAREDDELSIREKRETVRQMMKHAWDNYARFAWGKNELCPITRRGHTSSIFGSRSLGATIVDGMDTLYIMGLMDEFNKGRTWIEENLDLNKVSTEMSVFETNIRFVGGLLSCFALTGDTLFRDKAEHIAEKLLPAFQTPTGIPYALVNTRTGRSKNFAWASGGSSILSEFGSLHLEFKYLSDITGRPIYYEKVSKIRQLLKDIEKPKGLYPNYLNPKTGKWGQNHMSMGALGDSFYEYLLKAWLQSGKKDDDAREMYEVAVESIIKHMLVTSKSGLMYFSDLKYDRLEHKMDHLACFSGGLFGLGAVHLNNENSDEHMNVAKGITHTCHESYVRTSTGLGPESFRFSESMEAKALKSNEKYYILRPEVIESYFIMWRLTKDQKYREWGWEAVQALEKHCRVENGYTGIKNVYATDSIKDDVQQSFFLAETLKYLYLLFSDDDVIDLNEWVFNTEAHPLPIQGTNPMYRQKTE